MPRLGSVHGFGASVQLGSVPFALGVGFMAPAMLNRKENVSHCSAEFIPDSFACLHDNKVSFDNEKAGKLGSL